MLLYRRERCHLHNRPLVRLPRPHNIIEHRKQHSRSRHQNTKIHLRSRDRRRHGEKAKEKYDDPETHRTYVDDNAKEIWKMKRSPDKLVSFACIIRDVGHFADSAGTSAPEEKALGDDVRSVETAHAQRDDIIESGGRADIDQANKAGNERRYDDCEERDRGLRLDLQSVSQKFNTFRFGGSQTLLTDRHPGRPRSRAKAQTKRDVVARNAIVLAASIMMSIAMRTEAPALEPVAS